MKLRYLYSKINQSYSKINQSYSKISSLYVQISIMILFIIALIYLFKTPNLQEIKEQACINNEHIIKESTRLAKQFMIEHKNLKEMPEKEYIRILINIIKNSDYLPNNIKELHNPQHIGYIMEEQLYKTYLHAINYLPENDLKIMRLRVILITFHSCAKTAACGNTDPYTFILENYTSLNYYFEYVKNTVKG